MAAHSGKTIFCPLHQNTEVYISFHLKCVRFDTLFSGCLYINDSDISHEMNTTISVNMKGQGQELNPGGSSESEMYANPPNSGWGEATQILSWGCARQ